MILTTTDSIEGHKIIDYLGLVSGISTHVKAAFSFKTEKNTNMMSDVINKAKEDAFQNLKDHAIKLKANAVVGIQLDMETHVGSHFFISVTGTAVKVQV